MQAWRRIAVVAAVALTLSYASVSPTQASVRAGSANAEEISRMSGTVLYRASPGTVWSWSEDPAWLCSLVPSCTEAKRMPGSPETVTMQISLAGAGIPLPSALTTVPVSVVISDRVPGKSLNLSIEVDNLLGEFSSRAQLTLEPSGLDDARTRLTYKTLSAKGSGVTGSTVIKALTESVQSQMNSSAESFYEYVSLQPVTKIAVRGLRAQKNGKTPMQVTATTTFPSGFTPPTASGTVRIYVNGKLRCTTVMSASRATCLTLLPPRRTSTVMAVLKGTLSSGSPVVVGGSGYIRSGGRR